MRLKQVDLSWDRTDGAGTAGERVEVSGIVKRLFCQTDHFCAGVLEFDAGGEAKFAGPVAVEENTWVRLAGVWVVDPKWGAQIQVTGWTYAGVSDGELDPRGLARYLATCSDLRGIGPAKARKIAEKYGSAFGVALECHREEMAHLAGVPVETIQKLHTIWLERAAHNDLSVWLAGYGLTEYQVASIVREYAPRFGPGTREALESNPYRMIGEIDGFGFARVDSIALRMGVPKDSPQRIRAALLWCLEQEESGGGHTWTSRPDLEAAGALALSLDNEDWRERIAAGIEALIAADEVGTRAGERIGTARLLRQEDEIAVALGNVGRGWDPVPCSAAVLGGLTEEQGAAIRAAAETGGAVITGGAGTGKTHSVAALVRAFRAAGKDDILLCAPTGKAARRMVESLGRLGIAVEAKTIHRALGYKPGGGGWSFGPRKPLDVHLVVCDEASMADVPLLYRLIRATVPSRTALVLVGDHHQLPPVGPGAPLRDILARRLLPVHHLAQVHRQAGELKARSSEILSGTVAPGMAWPMVAGAALPVWAVLSAQKHREAPEALSTIERLYSTQFPHLTRPDGKPIDLVRDVQLVTPVHKGPLGTIELNAALQRIVQRVRYGVEVAPPQKGRRPPFLIGDRVIQTRNNYNLGPAGVMNGTIGRVLAIGTKEDPDLLPGDLLIDFDGEDAPIRIPKKGGALSDLALAYALSVHKMQGSEIPVLVAVVHKSHAFVSHRALLYTAVTRASQSAILVGDPWGVKRAAEHVVIDERRTLLGLEPWELGSSAEADPDVPFTAATEDSP